MIDFTQVQQAADRIAGQVKNTPIVQSSLLNKWLNQNIFFKCECLQVAGSFKARGAANFIYKRLERSEQIDHIVANSSGNHAQAVANIGGSLGIPVTIYASESISPIKAVATRSYGAELKLFPQRLAADAAVEEASHAANTVWIPPFNHHDIIAGQGTAAKEAIAALDNQVDAIFTPCGGGGLASGTLLTTRALQPNAKVIAAEPLLANDAARSIRSGKIETLEGPPNTIADGVATPAVGPLTFPLLQQLDDIVEVTETQILYWTQWLQHLLKLHVEPTSAMTMQAVLNWAKQAPPQSRAMVILTGGNISQTTQQKIWQHDHLDTLPSLEMDI